MNLWNFLSPVRIKFLVVGHRNTYQPFPVFIGYANQKANERVTVIPARIRLVSWKQLLSSKKYTTSNVTG